MIYKTVRDRHTRTLHDQRPTLGLVWDVNKHTVTRQHCLISVLLTGTQKIGEVINVALRQFFKLAPHPRMPGKILNALCRVDHTLIICEAKTLLKGEEDADLSTYSMETLNG
jgi:hypothetical protein